METSIVIRFVIIAAIVIACGILVYEILRKVKEEARRQAEESARLRAEDETQRQIEKEVQRKAEEDTRRREEEEVRRREEEVQRKAEDEARCKMEEEALRQAEEETRRKAEEEARRKAEEEARRQSEEEEKRRLIEEEVQRKAEEDKQREAENTRRQAEEEARRKTEEDARQKVEEEARRKAEEDARSEAEEAKQPTISLIHKIAPENRGGKPRDSSEKDDKEKTGILANALKEKTFSLRPEVVCWKDSRMWFVGIEIPEEYQECTGIVVTQNDIQINQDYRGRWILLHTSGIVQVRWEEIGYQFEIKLDRPYIVFRLAGQKINRGRLVQYATFGSYLVIVPDNWHRDEEVSGPARLSPEPVFVDGYQAHYFSLERGSDGKIGFRISTGEVVIIPTHVSRFELIGDVLSSDASDDIGPLFAGNPPNIKAVDKNLWKSIKTIVLGQEGSGRKRWRTYFAPDPDRIEQAFPDELITRRGGWYFVRLYDFEDTLVESMDFRFASALKEIIIYPHSPLPDLDGHSPVPIEFVHDAGCSIRLAEGGEEVLQVQRTHAKTIAVIPPNPVWDKTLWSIDIDNGLRTEAVILAQRVWWAIGDEDVAKVQPHWLDKPIVVPREAFSATSKQVLWLRLPKERWKDMVLVGFTRQKSQAYRVETIKRHVAIQLSDFADYQELEDKFLEHSLCLWIADKGTTVIKILSDKPLHQVVESPQANIKLTPAPTAMSHISKPPDFLDIPVNCKCCSTCTFATINQLGIRCIVGTWEERIDWIAFCNLFATHSCSRWQGEYTGPDGTMISG